MAGRQTPTLTHKLHIAQATITANDHAQTQQKRFHTNQFQNCLSELLQRHSGQQQQPTQQQQRRRQSTTHTQMHTQISTHIPTQLPTHTNSHTKANTEIPTQINSHQCTHKWSRNCSHKYPHTKPQKPVAAATTRKPKIVLVNFCKEFVLKRSGKLPDLYKTKSLGWFVKILTHFFNKKLIFKMTARKNKPF